MTKTNAIRRIVELIDDLDELSDNPGAELSAHPQEYLSALDAIVGPLIRDILPQSNQPLVGFCGYLRSGKSTAGLALKSQGWTHLSFASRLKAALAEIDPIVAVRTSALLEPKRFSRALEDLGPEEVKGLPEARRLMQTLGQAIRNQLGENSWANAAFEDYIPRSYFDDVRYRNEAQAIIDRGGLLIWLDNPNAKQGDHPSESGECRGMCHAVIENDPDQMSTEELWGSVQALVDLHLEGETW